MMYVLNEWFDICSLDVHAVNYFDANIYLKSSNWIPFSSTFASIVTFFFSLEMSNNLFCVDGHGVFVTIV